MSADTRTDKPCDIASAAAIAHLRWSMTPDIGPITFGRIVEMFGSAAQALGVSAGRLAHIQGLSVEGADRVARARDAVDVEPELALAARHDVHIICREDAEYPRALSELPDPPIVLYVKGRIKRQDTVALGVVGARRCTIYGREQARRFGQQIAARGITVISGLARGIDGEAHKGALEVGGRTIAVLGNGLARIYPPEHAELAARIIEAGAVVSELPMSTSPDSTNFLPRNRIIAGMSLGVLVIEAARRSGSLTTARMAVEYNREVFALPGRVDSEFSAGTNALIRDQEAKLVTCMDDIVPELGALGEVLDEPDPAVMPEAPLFAAAASAIAGDERTIFDALDREARSLEAIAGSTGLPPSRTASVLLTLQLKGLARQLPGNQFTRGGTAS